MEPGAVFYLQVSGGAGQALRTPGGLVGTSSVHSAKSYRACLEVAYGTAGPRGGGSSYPVLGHIHLMPCSNCPSWVCCPHRHHSHSHWDYWMHITWRGRECLWPCPIQSSSCTEVSLSLVCLGHTGGSVNTQARQVRWDTRQEWGQSLAVTLPWLFWAQQNMPAAPRERPQGGG